MGDPRKQHKKYAKPRKLFDKTRISEENDILQKYGLKNKREIWKADFKLENIRKQAKNLINNPAKQQEFLEKLRKQGFNVKSIDDVLGLNKEALLERRLQTVVVRKGVARTLKHARQLISHKHIAVSGKIVNIPSYHVPIELEKDIIIIRKTKNATPKQAVNVAINK